MIGTYLSSTPPSDIDAEWYHLDLSSPENIAKCVAEISRSEKKIDILVNNAGVLLDEEETNVIPEKLRKTLEVNLIGTIDFTERIIPLVNNDGHIINISSSAGSLGMADGTNSHYPRHYPSYKISKTALNMYTRTLAVRLKDAGIVVSSVHPGWVRTDMGGQEADISPEEAAEGIYYIAVSHPKTGQFWFKDERMPW